MLAVGFVQPGLTCEIEVKDACTSIRNDLAHQMDVWSRRLESLIVSTTPPLPLQDFIWDTGANTKVYPAILTVLNAAAADLFPGFKAMAVVPPRAVSTLAGWGLGFLG